MMKFAAPLLALALQSIPVQPAITAEPVPVAPAAAPASVMAVQATVVSLQAEAARVGIAASFDPEALDPGEYVWRPELSTSGPVEVVVSIPQQIAYVYRGGTLIGVTTVSTGRPGHRTPTGRFPIIEKRREHYSNLYNNAPMPFMQRLTMDGIALHAGQIPGRPASHGCVRLPLDFARILFGATSVGANVHIVDGAPTPDTALAMARGEVASPAAAQASLAN